MLISNAPCYRLLFPLQAVGANLIYFDLFNAAGSALDLHVYSIRPIVSGATAVTGAVSVDLNLNRTTAVGTGGTAATRDGTAFTAATINAIIPGSPIILDGITARLTPSGGATAGAWLSWCSVFTEETNAGTYLSKLINLARSESDEPSILVPTGSGLSVVQGSVASVGNIGFEVGFQAVKR